MQLLKTAALCDLYFLLRYVLNRPFVDNDWWFERCREVQFEPNGYLDLWSREHGKSSIITIALSIFDILNDPEITIGIFSHTKPNAKSFMRVIKREFESNDLLKKLFPEILYEDPAAQSPKWSEDAGILVKRKGNPPEATIEAHGLVDGQPTGRHFDIRVYDDVVTVESVSTSDQMRKVMEALDMSNNLGKKGGVRRMIGTRYKLGDAYEEYIKRGVIKPRIYAATDNGRVDGKPVFFTQEEWDFRVSDNSAAIIASQMLQNPLAEDSVIFQSDWIRMWPAYITNQDGTIKKDDNDRDIINELPAFDAVFLTLDGAFSEKTSADDSCLLALGLFKATEGSPKYSVMVLDCFMEKVAYPDLRDEVIRQYGNKFGENDKSVDGIIIEDKASGSALIPDLRKAGITVYPYKPGGLDKVARANLVSPLIRDGYLWIPESRKRKGYPMNWLSKWYEQMCLPAGSKIITIEGIKRIENINIGDLVLTHKGRFMPVKSIGNRKTKELVALKGKTLCPLFLTPEHPVYGAWQTKERKIDAPSWIPASELKARKYKTVIRSNKPVIEAYPSPCHSLILPMIKPTKIQTHLDLRKWGILYKSPYKFLIKEDKMGNTHKNMCWIKWKQELDYSFGRICGLYLAEGCTSDTQIRWSFNEKTEQHFVNEVGNFIRDRIGSHSNVHNHNGSSVVAARITLMKHFFLEFGHGAANKKIPAWVWNTPDCFVDGLLSGYMDGDGCYVDSASKWIGCTVSESLAWGLRLLALRRGIKANVLTHKGIGSLGKKIKNRIVKSVKTAYEISWIEERKNNGAGIIKDELCFYSLMESHSDNLVEEITVYNLHVEEDESYCTTGGLVHNCYFPNVAHDDGVDSAVMGLSTLDKMGYLRGKVAPPREEAFWSRNKIGNYSGE